MKFIIQIFQTWKAMESQPNGFHIFYLCTCVRPLYTLSFNIVYCQTRFGVVSNVVIK